jgi:hypothetical protein
MSRRTSRSTREKSLPILLVQTISFLENHLETEGILRMSGSVDKIKEVKLAFEKDGFQDKKSTSPRLKTHTRLLASFAFG